MTWGQNLIHSPVNNELILLRLSQKRRRNISPQIAEQYFLPRQRSHSTKSFEYIHLHFAAAAVEQTVFAR